MTETKTPTLTIDQEFQRLIPALTKQERAGLERSILEEGVRDKIIVWGNTIIDGHNRYEIASGNNVNGQTLDFGIDYVGFESHQSAKIWIIENQLEFRRNLSDADKIDLAETKREIISASQPKNQHDDTTPDVKSRPAEGDEPRWTKDERSTDGRIAKEVGVSGSKVLQYRKIKEFGDERLVEGLREKLYSMNNAYFLVQTYHECGSDTYDALWENEDDDATVRFSTPQLKHLIDLGKKGNGDLTTADLVELVESGGATGVQKAHEVRHKERLEEERNRRREDQAEKVSGMESEWWLNEPWESGIGNLADGAVRLLLTDPPYGTEYQSNYRTLKHDKIPGDEKLQAQTALDSLLRNIKPKLAEHSHLLIFTSQHHDIWLRHLLETLGYDVKGVITWLKNNTTAGDLEGTFAPKDEWIIHAVKGRPEMNYREDRVIQANRIQTKDHPTEKPTHLLKKLIEATTYQDQLVVDPFGGVASTLVAAQECGRKGWGCEIDKNYYQIGLTRSHGETGEED